MTNIPKQKLPADGLWYRAMERMDKLDKEDDARAQDITEWFYYQLHKKLARGELLNISILGPVRMGKSTIGMTLCWEIKRMIEELYKVKRPISNANIVRDQNEYARLVKKREESFKHECDVIDEWAEMETTGFNSTVEEKFIKDFSDRQAARYYHRIACSPTNITDPNADILLEVVPGSRLKGKTLCILKYRLNTVEMTQNITLGHVVIDVTKTLQANWYQEYLYKKEEKWKLLNKHNVLARELEYAQIALNTYSRIKGLCKYGFTQKKHIKDYFKEEAAKAGMLFSIIGASDMIDSVSGLAERKELLEKILKMKKKARKPEDKKQLDKEYTEIKKSMKETMGYFNTLILLKEQYDYINESLTETVTG